MTELRPLSDDAADPGGALLSSARKIQRPGGASGRAIAALGMGLGLGLAAIPASAAAAAAAAPAGTATGTAAVVGSATGLKVAAIAVAVSGTLIAGVVGFVALRDQPSAAPPTPTHAESALAQDDSRGTDGVGAVAPPPPGAPIQRDRGQKPGDKNENVVPRPPGARAVRDDLQAELRRLDEARAASPAEAVTLIQSYRRDFPRGALGYEASLVEIDALERSGQHQRAVARARLLLQRQPTGPATNRLRAIVGAHDASAP